MPFKSKYFTELDFACPCCGQCEVPQKTVDFADTVYFAMRKKIKPASVYRCEKRNAAVGGAKDSQHLKGLALDWPTADAEDRFVLVELAVRHGARGIEVDAKHVHTDFRDGPAVFLLG